jgi:hypothetical protein
MCHSAVLGYCSTPIIDLIERRVFIQRVLSDLFNEYKRGDTSLAFLKSYFSNQRHTPKMLSNKTVLLALSTLLVGAIATPVAAPGSGCAAVHIITARASTELPGEGIIGTVVGNVVSRSKQTVSREAVDYPALLAPYESSEAAGVAAMKTLLARKTAACPDTKIVLMGYSQGAHVSGDVLQANASGSNKG